MSKRKNESPGRRDNDGLHKRRGIWYYCLTINGQRRFFSTKTRHYMDSRNARSRPVKAQFENRLPIEGPKRQFERLLSHRKYTPKFLRP